MLADKRSGGPYRIARCKESMDDRSDSQEDVPLEQHTVPSSVSARPKRSAWGERPEAPRTPEAFVPRLAAALGDLPEPPEPPVLRMPGTVPPLVIQPAETSFLGLRLNHDSTASFAVPATEVIVASTVVPGSSPVAMPAHDNGPAASAPARPEPDFTAVFAASPRALNDSPLRDSQMGFYPASPGYPPPLAPQSVLAPPASWAVGPSVGDAPPAQFSKPAPGWSRFAAGAAKYAVMGVVAWFAAVFLLILAYRFVDPPISALMLQRKLMGENVAQTWVPIEAMSPRLVRAVLVSEDGRFCQHWGVDIEAIEAAIARSGRGTPRGASTISMQVAKNLFLWPSKSYVRKVLEVPLTMAIELLWPKKRIMEVYLNIAEWGPGIFGAEQAARHHFGKSALRLNDRESARLAVSLPNPIQRDAGQPGPGTRRLAALNMARARGTSSSVTGCILGYAPN